MLPCPNRYPLLCPQEQNSELQAKYQQLLVRTRWEGGAEKPGLGTGSLCNKHFKQNRGR